TISKSGRFLYSLDLDELIRLGYISDSGGEPVRSQLLAER
ncbi:uncharacterized protein METZ01_LOCUS49773, partial [marine metagenome]